MGQTRLNFCEATTSTTGVGDITLVRKNGFTLPSDKLAVGETAEYFQAVFSIL